MIRRCFQTGCLLKKGKRRKTLGRALERACDPSRWNNQTRTASGSPRACKGALRTRSPQQDGNASSANQRRRYRAEATITFRQFITDCWEPAVMPHLKSSSVRYYGLQIRCHLLAKFGPWRLRDITKAEVQRFLADKRKQGLSGSSVHGIRTALGKVLQAAVDWNYLEHNSARGIRLGIALKFRNESICYQSKSLCCSALFLSHVGRWFWS